VAVLPDHDDEAARDHDDEAARDHDDQAALDDHDDEAPRDHDDEAARDHDDEAALDDHNDRAVSRVRGAARPGCRRAGGADCRSLAGRYFGRRVGATIVRC
jgi:hypothetical protein